MTVVICFLFYNYRLAAEQKEFYGDDLEEDEVYDESDEDGSDSDQITTEIIQEELKKLKDIQMGRITNSTSSISSDAGQDEIPNTNTTKNEEPHPSTNFIQDMLRENSPEPREESKNTLKENLSESREEPKNTNTKEKRRISFAEPCVIESKGIAEEEISIPLSQEDCSSLKQDDTHENSEDEDDIIRIKFSHSSHIPDIPESNDTEIQSPVDIYKIFNAPKSILKRSPNDMIYNKAAPPLNKNSSSTDTEDEEEYVHHSTFNSVSKNNNFIMLLYIDNCSY